MNRFQKCFTNVLQMFYNRRKKEKAPLAEVGLTYWFLRLLKLDSNQRPSD